MDSTNTSLPILQRSWQDCTGISPQGLWLNIKKVEQLIQQTIKGV